MASLTAPAEFTLQRKPSERTRGPAHWVWSHAARYWPILVMLVFGAVGNAALAAAIPVLVGAAFNQMLKPEPDTSILLPLALILGGSQIVRGVLQFGRNFGAELMAQKIERDIRDELYVSLLGKSMTFHNLQPVGDTMARATNDVREVNFMFSPGVNLVVGSALFIVVPFFIIPRYNPALLLTPIVFCFAYFIALWRYLKTMSPVTDEVRGTFGDMNTHLSEALDGVETMKSAAQEGAETETFVVNARRVRNAFVHQGDIEARFLPGLFYGLALAGGMVHALLLFRQGLLNTGDVIAYFGLLRMLDFPTYTSAMAYTQISLGLSGARRILDLINHETNLDQNAAGYAAPMRGEIEFRDVSFAYPESTHAATATQRPRTSVEEEKEEALGSLGDYAAGSSIENLKSEIVNSEEPVLSRFSFHVRPGQTIAIVGQTGAGKTSLVKLINRTYDVTSGQVLVDGVDVRDWNLAALRSQVSMIEQDIFLFSRSISDNIAFGKPGATRGEVLASADAAQAHEFVETFDQKYDTVIGERGVTLSGGQRQRLALARAFVTDPRILILDDSTSAIDSATEDRIQRAIASAARGRTTILITHRLSQIRWADLIIVLRKGRIAAMGTHDELMKSSDVYGRIFRE
ncbi:MAG TPA: ABC transporter ATP-binding protein [Anaerolineales bacterium]|nr:ABC transporter ATP-binding protein [Anaerolineales bacterium]